MKPIHTFLITPKKERYDNIKKVNDTELILNSGITDHKFVSREAVIHETPIIDGKHFTRGTELYVHHNIFRRWHDVRGIEKNSKSSGVDWRWLICTNGSFNHFYLYKL